MAQPTYKLMCIQSLREMDAIYNKSMVKYCDNQVYIVNYPLFHEETKHIEMDCHFIRDTMMQSYNIG